MPNIGFWATAGGAGGAAGSYELIQSNILTTATNTLTFASIPQTYKHLQIRFAARASGGTERDLNLGFNAAVGSSAYWHHNLFGAGGAVTDDYTTAVGSFIYAGKIVGNDGVANAFGVGIIDIADYASTTKNKTTKLLNGNNGDIPRVVLGSGVWLSNDAITSITFYDPGVNFMAGSRFSLYGLKGA